MSRIMPRPTPATAPYWEGCRAGELRLQYCASCDRYQFYPRIVCSRCHGEELAWKVATGRGVVASFSVVRRALSPAYDAPYVVALIDLQEGPRLMSQVVGCDPDEVRVGAAVRVEFEDWGEDTAVPVFRLSGGN